MTKHLLTVMLLSTVMLAQAPTNVNAILLDSNSNNLGAHITWNPVAGTSYYSIYGKAFSYIQSCSNVTNWTGTQNVLDIDLHNPGANSYNAYLDNNEVDSTGWGNYWCYGVSATDSSGHESAIIAAPNSVKMGFKWYVNWFYMTPDCSTRLTGTNPPGFRTLIVTRVRNGVSTVMPFVTAPNPWRAAGFGRQLSYDKWIVNLTLPDGKAFTFPWAFGSIDGTPTVDDYAPYIVISVNSADDSLCNVQWWHYYQKGINNP